ncbi:MAG: 3,4-dihydroxy-2-butanone-4-phosphate synthase [Deltaproteobacteria bacterium]|nr:3,4-dihydroxy-2-butanone-4-phosphate synthase [Deltaproteobacteria bacterium]
MTLETVQHAIDEIRAGRMVILVDDEDRENEGDLCLAAEKVTPEAVNFMAKYGRGLVCLALTDRRIAQLDLPLMVANNTSTFGTAFTVSIEARHGVSTGISAADRATTIRAAVAPHAAAADLVRPGHVFPLRAQPGGVLVRTGQTEGAVDLARLAGLEPAGVICEIMTDDGSMARLPDLERFAREHQLLIVSIADLIEYRLRMETLVRRLVSREVTHPQWGTVTLCAYSSTIDLRQHLVVVKGDLSAVPAPVVRVHAGYSLSSVFGDLFSNDRQLLGAAMARICDEGCGVLLCIDRAVDEVPLDRRINEVGERVETTANPPQSALRDIGLGSQILRELGLTHIRLLSNNPKRLKGIEGFGLHVTEVVPLQVARVTVVPTGNLKVVGGNADPRR